MRMVEGASGGDCALGHQHEECSAWPGSMTWCTQQDLKQSLSKDDGRTEIDIIKPGKFISFRLRV
jgi:hypothetical protein